jgi:sugar transferase EpsL
MKRVLDFTLALVGIIALLIPFFITYLLVKIKLGSPVLFKQKRPGISGYPFYIYKFRTMTNKRDKDGKLLSDESRLSNLGKFLRRYSLDELPQLINVIKGDISFVGPRPLLMEYLELYTPEQARRHEVRPGITGWAQVNGRNAISWEDKFELDVWYVDNQSFWLDIKILFLTIKKVFKSEGVSQDGHVTMEKFRGSSSGKGNNDL